MAGPEVNFRANSIVAIVRSFQAGKTFESFDDEKFVRTVVGPMRKLLSACPPQLKSFIIVSAADPDSPAGEKVIDGRTPTMHAVERYFSEELKFGLIDTIGCTNWGRNFGSATALNDGIELAAQMGADTVLIWSPEIDLTGHRLSLMIDHMERHSLQLCGYARNGWTERLQWMFVQNTIALWRMSLLKVTGGFNPICNGDGKTTVETTEFGAVPLAGMEDYHTYLSACAYFDTILPWGFVGVNDPAKWDLSSKLPGTVEYQKNEEKIARQTAVMHAYARQIYPQLGHPIEVWREVTKRMHVA